MAIYSLRLKPIVEKDLLGILPQTVSQLAT